MADSLEPGEVVRSTKFNCFGIVIQETENPGAITMPVYYKVFLIEGFRSGQILGRPEDMMVPAELEPVAAGLVNPQDYGYNSEEELFRRWRELAGIEPA